MEEARSWARPLLATLAMAMCVATLWPFARMLAWGAIIAICCEPAVARLAPRMRSRGVAALVVAVGLTLAIALPMAVALGSAAGQVAGAFDWGKAWLAQGIPMAPSWVDDLPVAGHAAADFWNERARGGLAPVVEWGKSHAGEAAAVAAGFAGLAAGSVAAALAALVTGAAMMAKGDKMAEGLRGLSLSLVGPGGPAWLALIASALRGVAVGVCGTALALSVCVGAAMALAGIPAVSLLSCLAMALCLAQIGPLPILAPAGIYLAMQGRYGAAVGMAVLAVVLSVIDGLMRPLLIRRHVRMPMLLIFSGVVGGLMAFGLIGLFLGPAALAVGSRVWERAREEGGSHPH